MYNYYFLNESRASCLFNAVSRSIIHRVSSALHKNMCFLTLIHKISLIPKLDFQIYWSAHLLHSPDTSCIHCSGSMFGQRSIHMGPAAPQRPSCTAPDPVFYREAAEQVMADGTLLEKYTRPPNGKPRRHFPGGGERVLSSAWQSPPPTIRLIRYLTINRKERPSRWRFAVQLGAIGKAAPLLFVDHSVRVRVRRLRRVPSLCVFCLEARQPIGSSGRLVHGTARRRRQGSSPPVCSSTMGDVPKQKGKPVHGYFTVYEAKVSANPRVSKAVKSQRAGKL